MQIPMKVVVFNHHDVGKVWQLLRKGEWESFISWVQGGGWGVFAFGEEGVWLMFSGFKTPQSASHLSAFFLTLPQLQLYRFANPARENWLWDSLYIQSVRLSVCLQVWYRSCRQILDKNHLLVWIVPIHAWCLHGGNRTCCTLEYTIVTCIIFISGLD